MASAVVVFHHVAYRKLIPRLLRQPRRMAPRRIGESLGRPFSALPCCAPADPLLAERRRSQLCSRAFTSPAWFLPLCCPTMRQSSSVRAGAPLCWSLRSPDSPCSSSDRSSVARMSSSTSSSDGQGKAKPKSQTPKRGNLQSNTSPGECFIRGVSLRETQEASSSKMLVCWLVGFYAVQFIKLLQILIPTHI